MSEKTAKRLTAAVLGWTLLLTGHPWGGTLIIILFCLDD